MVRAERTMADYDEIFNPIREARKTKSGHQQGDPNKAGKALVELLAAPDPPARLLLGTDAAEYMRKELDGLRSEFAEWESLTSSTDFDPGQ